LAWIGPCATSRVVAIQLGHGPTIFSKPEYRTVVHNAILWSAGRLKCQSRARPGLFSGRLKRGTAMKLGLYSITYLGLWYRGEALPLPAMITRAKQYGYDGIEIDGKRPHGNPLDWPTPRCRELRSIADGEGIDIFAVAANNDFSNPVPEVREAQICYVRDLIR